LLTVALAAEIGQSAPILQAERPASDPAGVPNIVCLGRSGLAGRSGLSAPASIGPGTPVKEAPSEGGTMKCAAAMSSKPIPDGPMWDAIAGGAPPSGFSGAMRDQGGPIAGKVRAYQGAAPANVIGLFGQFGFIRDRLRNMRRARLRLGFQPAPHLDLGLCATDGFSDIRGTGLSGRCLATVESEISYVYALGQANYISRGEVGGVGGKVQYDLSAPIKDGAALIASLSYRRVPTIVGRAPDIRRLESAIKYRFRVAQMLGVALGVTGGRGTEPRSLREENKVQLGLGLTF